jgi:signal transduction histidine kinase
MQEILQRLFGDVVNEQNYAEFQKELGKKFVAKSDYNAKVAEMKGLQEQVGNLEGQAAEREQLAALVEELRTRLAALQAESEASLQQLRVDNAVDKALLAAGAKNAVAVRALLDLSKSEFVDGELVGLREQVAALQTAKETAFLFAKPYAGEAANWRGFVPAAAGDLQDMDSDGGFRLRLEQASAAQDSLEAIRIKQAAAAKGIKMPW